ncbi:MAG: hypothetical protein FWE95_05820, partial [Planctomycetaceae bacterium]|nr:hypothetical protein [Planctomycetaceae bacterium]
NLFDRKCLVSENDIAKCNTKKECRNPGFGDAKGLFRDDYLLLTWEYPGHAGIDPLYRELLRYLAGKVEQNVTIAALPDRERDVDFIAFAAYPGKAFFLNTDCLSERSVNVNVDGKSETLTLQPTEIRVLVRPWPM